MAILNNTQLRRKSYLRLFLRYIGSLLIGLSFALFFVVAKRGLGAFANVIFSFCTICCMLCLYADLCLKLGGEMGGNVRLHKEKDCLRHGMLLGVLSTIPYYITYVILILSKAGAIGNFYGWFRLINSQYFPLLDLFAKGDTLATAIPVDYLVIFALFPLINIVVCHMCFKVSYERIDIAKKVLYKNKD